MISKELRSVWWKVLVVAVPVVWAAPTLPSYERAERISERFSSEVAVDQVSSMYTGGLWALALLAILLGSVLVSAEVSRNTIFLLLSKPLSRNRTAATAYS
jgi:nitric oxide reductase large subunit